MADVNSDTSRETKNMERNVKFSSVTMAMGNSERKIGSTESFDFTRTTFLNNPGVPASTKDERIREEMEKKKEKTKKKKSRKHREKLESIDPYETEDKETRRLRELQERHMRILDDLTKLRNHYYSVYMSKLTDQVAEQRKEIQRRTDRLNQRILLKELKQKKESHRVKKRHQRSQLNHDNTFLLNLPRTRLHQIICLEEKMAREGKLRTIEELEKFWSDIGKPETFRQMLGGSGDGLTAEGNETSMGSQEDVFSHPSLRDSPNSSLTSLNPEGLPADAFTRGLSQIYEDSEPGTRPGTKTGDSRSWAVTQQLKKEKSRRESRKVAPPTLREQEPDPALQLAKVEFPQLACFSMDLEHAKEDPEAIKMRDEYRRKARQRDYDKRRFRKMYEASLTHQAATQRILTKSPDFLDVLRGPSLADVVNTESYASESDCNSDVHADDMGLGQRLLALTMSGERPGVLSQQYPTAEDDGMTSEGQSTRQSSASSRESQSRRREVPSPHPPVGKYARPDKPSPLMLDSILPECRVKEAKGLSSLWINYGKFLPSLE